MPDELRDLAETGLRMAQEKLKRAGGLSIDPLFLFRHPDGHTQELLFPDDTGDLLNSGRAKDILFAWVRRAVYKQSITAVVFVSDGWISKSTEKGISLTQDEFDKLLEKHGTEGLAQMGYVERSEVLMACAQDENRVWLLQRFYGRRTNPDRILWGECSEKEFPQKHFQGRQKMFGDLREENLR